MRITQKNTQQVIKEELKITQQNTIEEALTTGEMIKKAVRLCDKMKETKLRVVLLKLKDNGFNPIILDLPSELLNLSKRKDLSMFFKYSANIDRLCNLLDEASELAKCQGDQTKKLKEIQCEVNVCCKTYREERKKVIVMRNKTNPFLSVSTSKKNKSNIIGKK